MAITPSNNVNYCSSTTGGRFEWRNPDRSIPEKDWAWEGYEFGSGDVPIRVNTTSAVGTFIEGVTLNLANGYTAATTAVLEPNKYYTFTVSGLITITGSVNADACWEIRQETGESQEAEIVPSNRLTINDAEFPKLFEGAAPYDPVLHLYTIGFVGNNAPVTFSFDGGTAGEVTIDINENDYSIEIFKGWGDTPPDPLPPNLYEEIRQRPFDSLNLACGGDCPTRTSFSCDCNETRSCYLDDNNGAITKLFEGASS